MTTEQQQQPMTNEYVYEHTGTVPEEAPPPCEPPAAAPPPPQQPTNYDASPQEPSNSQYANSREEEDPSPGVGMLKEAKEDQHQEQHPEVSHEEDVAMEQQPPVLSYGEAMAPTPAMVHTAPSPTAVPPAKKRRTGTKRSAARPWNDMLFELLRFRLVHGNVMVPFKSGGELGKWVANQRAQYVGLQKSIVKDEGTAKTKWLHSEGTERLTEERMKVLTSIGFIWDVVQADNDARWKKRYEELLHYKAVNGHCNVPQSTDLGKWVKMQRENKHEADLKKAGTTPLRKKPKPCLSQARIAKLEEIGFQWRVAKPAVGWDKRFQQLEDYKNEHGDCNVPQSFPPDKPFGRWVMKQRCQHSLKLRGEKSQLTDERERKLNDIGFSWVAPGFSKKTVTMPGEEEVDVHAHLHTLQVHALQNAVHQEVVVAQDMVVPAHHHQDEFSSWGV